MPPGALVHQHPHPQSLGYGCCELPPHCTDLNGLSTGETGKGAGTRRKTVHLSFVNNEKGPVHSCCVTEKN